MLPPCTQYVELERSPTVRGACAKEEIPRHLGFVFGNAVIQALLATFLCIKLMLHCCYTCFVVRKEDLCGLQLLAYARDETKTERTLRSNNLCRESYAL